MGRVATGLLVMLCLALLMPYCAFLPKVGKLRNNHPQNMSLFSNKMENI
jgi:hypothetical protein